MKRVLLYRLEEQQTMFATIKVLREEEFNQIRIFKYGTKKPSQVHT